MSLRPAWLTFRRYAAATTAMTMTLFALGVYTAATGSGLACQAQWPLCSDRLIPALTINPDFIEWFHRVWAMITGFLIVGVAGWSWLGSFDRRTRLAATFAVVILPLQITVGAITVTLSGLVPGGYAAPTHAAHLIVALCIFTLLGLVTLWGGTGGVSLRLRRIAAGVAVGGTLVGALFSRAVPLFTYSPGAQAAFYLAGLSAHLGLLAVVAATTEAAMGGASGLTRSTARRVRTLAAASMAALVATLLLGRDLVLYTVVWRRANLVALALAFAFAMAAAWMLRDADTVSGPSTPVGGD